jgi:CubicO group peptidase (beta-lactamase class C family)
MAILQLQEKGKLNLQDSICQYIAECPQPWQGIKIFNLLTHTSGIPNFTDFPDYKKTMMLPTTVPELLARFKDKPLEFKPGEKFKYSNSGYEVLGAIVEKVSGEPYAKYLDQNIFAPLRMRDTGCDSTQRIIPHRASGYSFEGDTLVNAPYLDMTIPYSAGSLYSTVEDLYRWDRALYTEKLVSKKTLDQMFTPYKDDYSLGWIVRTEFNHKLITHDGGINGFSSSIRRYPDANVCVIVLSNLQNADTEKISHDLAAILFHQPFELPKEHHTVKVDLKIYDAYAGQYQLAPDFILTVTREGNRLMTQATGQEKIEIFPESETKFFLKVIDAQIDFVKDASGQVMQLILHQGGHDRPAIKIK